MQAPLRRHGDYPGYERTQSWSFFKFIFCLAVSERPRADLLGDFSFPCGFLVGESHGTPHWHSRYCDVAVNLDSEKEVGITGCYSESTIGMKNNKLPSLQAILDHARTPYLQSNSGPSSVCFRRSVHSARTPQSRCRETLSRMVIARDGTEPQIPLAAADADLVHLEGSCCSTRQRTAMFPAYWKLRLDT